MDLGLCTYLANWLFNYSKCCNQRSGSQRTGWDIKDLEDQARFTEDVATKPMSKLDLGPRDSRCYLRGYKCYQNNQAMANPYDPDSAEYRDWADGYHQAVIDRAKATE